MRPGKEAVKVVIRLRPLLQPFEDEEMWAVNQSRTQIYTTKNPKDIETPRALKERDIRRRYVENTGPQSFSFDHVYGPDVKTSQIYQHIGRPVILSVLDGYNGSIFMYGQTTSGKTYSMLGTPDLPGILPCSIKHIFQAVQQDEEYDYSVWVSYLEIYNEHINDLLVPGSNNLKIKEDPAQGVSIAGLKQQQVWNFNQVIILMNYGEEHRSYRETNIHEHSSRSHTLFQVYIESKRKDQSDGKVRYSVLNLVDLAGSERLNEFEVRQHNQMEETGHINKSLFVLSNVVNKLAEGKRNAHIPYRDSKLTRILSNALGGNSLSTVICTVSPAAMNYNLTLSTLRFAVRAKSLKNRPQINELMSEDAAINQFKAQIIRTKEELRQTQDELMLQTTRNNELMQQLTAACNGSPGTAGHEISELREAHSRDRARIAELEQQLAMQHSGASGSSMQQLSVALEQERSMRARLESELARAKKSSIGAQSSQREENFIQDVLFTIDSEIQLDPDVQRTWIDETGKLNNSYQYELQQIQTSYIESLAQVAQDMMPQHMGMIQRILGVGYEDEDSQDQDQPMQEEAAGVPDFPNQFTGIDSDFQSIVDDYLKSGQTSTEYADVVVNRLKDKHDAAVEGIDRKYQESFAEGTNREELKASYESAQAIVERAYVDALQQLDEYLGYVDDEEEALQNYPVPISQDAAYAESGTPYRPQKALHAYLWGSGKDGRCGSGGEDKISTPTPLFSEPSASLNIQKLACGYHHSAAITDQGQLYTWGRGIFGQLGHSNNESYTVPVKVNALTSHVVTDVACGWQHTAILTNQGAVYTWGYGEDGQLGHGDGQDYVTPHQIEALRGEKVSKIACGHSHSGCIASGTLFTWGCNPDCRLFLTSMESQLAPNKVDMPIDITDLSLGVSHSAIVTHAGDLYTAGLGQEGQLGFPCDSYSNCHRVDGFDRSNAAIKVCCGDCYTIVLTKGHQVYSFGKGAHGRLGLGDEDNHFEPKRLVTLANEEIIEICAGCRHAGAVSLSGRLFTWGFNFYEQLGIGDGDFDVNTPTLVRSLSNVKNLAFGYFHSGVLVADSQ